MITCSKNGISKLQNHIDGSRNLAPTNFAVFNENSLDSLLDSLNIKTKFYCDEIICEVCGEKITKVNLRTIIPSKMKPIALCTKPQCIDEYYYTHK